MAEEILLSDLLQKYVEVQSFYPGNEFSDEGYLIAFDRDFIKLQNNDRMGNSYCLYINRQQIRLIKWKEAKRRA